MNDYNIELSDLYIEMEEEIGYEYAKQTADGDAAGDRIANTYAKDLEHLEQKINKKKDEIEDLKQALKLIGNTSEYIEIEGDYVSAPMLRYLN